MWNKRDYLTLATAATLAFGITLAAFWTPAVNAVDAGKSAITNIKVPALKIDKMEITAELDKTKPHTVLIHVKNTGASAATAEFTASANVYGPVSLVSRAPSPAKSVWSDNYSLSVPAGQTQTIQVKLPTAAFEFAAADKKSKTSMTSGRSQLSLTGGASKKSLIAIAIPLASG